MAQSVIRLDQDRETAVVVVRRRDFAYRYAYVRSHDARLSEVRGEDYLVVSEQDDRLVFALCDGVGQSFKGDLGSRRLGEALIEWFARDLCEVESEEAAGDLLDQRLRELTTPVSELVRAAPLSAGLPEMVVKALEQKRTNGTESTFVAGLLDLRADRLMLAWLGDSRLKIWQKNGATDGLGDTFLSSERWSSRLGPVGKSHVRLRPLHHYHRIVAHSDGLNSVAARLQESPSTSALTALINKAHTAPASDDISFFEICFDPKAWIADEAPNALAIVPVRKPDRAGAQPTLPPPPVQYDPRTSPFTAPHTNPPFDTTSPGSPSTHKLPGAPSTGGPTAGPSAHTYRTAAPSSKMPPPRQPFLLSWLMQPLGLGAVAILVCVVLAVLLVSRLVSSWFPPATPEPVVPAIIIEKPQPNAQVGGQLRITGRTTLRPFRSILDYHVVVVAPNSGQLLAKGSIEVEPARDGSGRFNQEISFDPPKQDAVVRIVLYESIDRATDRATIDRDTIISTASVDLIVAPKDSRVPPPVRQQERADRVSGGRREEQP